MRGRAERIGALDPALLLADDSDLGTLLGHVESTHPSLLVVDPVQTIQSAQVDGGAGGVAQSMRLISIYVGELHHSVDEPEALLSRVNLVVDTLDRYSQRLDEVLQTLTVLEMRDSATIRDVATVMQRMEMIRRITSEINGYLEELGSEGRLLALQVDDPVRGSASERALVMRDYIHDPSAVAASEAQLAGLAGDKLVDLMAIANVLGLGVFDVTDLDRLVQPRGIRALSLVPRLPWSVIKEISKHWGTLAELREATVEDLQEIEGIGPYRAKLISENLERQRAMATSGIVGW